MVDSQSEQKVSDALHGLIFDLLLVTDGRTTDFLETLLNEKMKVQVIRQEQIGGETDPNYIRESILICEKSQFIVSHNIALVYSKHVPSVLFEKIARRHEGIGKAISSLSLHTFRKVVDFGFINEAAMVDLFQQPIKIHFPNLQNKVPYKKYFIYFESKPGIQLLEYFHPSIIRHRLQQGILKDQSNKEE